jgi:uncharacterized coiled-coil DUF342 family protein
MNPSRDEAIEEVSNLKRELKELNIKLTKDDFLLAVALSKGKDSVDISDFKDLEKCLVYVNFTFNTIE